MIKFQITTWMVVLSVLARTSEVQGVLVKDHELPAKFQTQTDIVPTEEESSYKFPDVWGNQNGLLARTINSQKPTRFPTVRPTEPSASPTESPAPSPSPSDFPTKDPDRPTDVPSAAPTESPAPSPSPSDFPSPSPSARPSDAPSASPTKSAAPSSSPSSSPSASPSASPSSSPSASPTISFAPSSSPSSSPSASPSASPSFAPSASPTTSPAPSSSPSSSPSDSPSSSPSAAPTQRPSDSPSDAPSMSPTSVTDRTKSATSTLLLEEIKGEMDRMTLAEFELFTLDFLRKKIPVRDEYVLNTLACTVLSQKRVINPDYVPNADQPLNRNLETEDWSVGLEVEIRTVSVVTDGRVPPSFNMTEEVLYSFYNHWDQYLWQLGNSVEFFNPLVEVSDWVPVLVEDAVQDKKKGKAGFVLAVLFSFVAFGLAIFASYLAIRKHMGRTHMTPYKTKKTRGILFSPKNSPLNYDNGPVLNYLTQTMSDDKDSPINYYHDGDVEGGGAMTLIKNVNIDVDEHGMESVVLTPRANFQSPTASIRNGLFVVDEGSDDDHSPLKSPMATSPMADPASASRIGGQIKKWLTPRALQAGNNRRLSSDPPENQTALGYNYGKDYIEPDAIKASTKNNSGVFTTDKSTVDGRSKVSGISYNKKAVNEEGQFTLPISFFSNRGPASNVSGVDSPMSSLADSNASSFFAIGNMNKSFAGNKSNTGAIEDDGYEVSALKVKMNNPSSNTVAPIPRTNQEAPSFLKQATQPSVTNENMPSTFVRNLSPSESSAKESSVKFAAKRFQGQKKQQQPLREIQPPSSTVGVETILGARSRDSTDDEEEKTSNVSSSFLKNRSMFSPNMRKNNKTTPANQPKKQQPSYKYGKVSVEVQEQHETRSVGSHSTLGARPMAKKGVEDDKSTVSAFSTLSSIMKRPGCYDVYAPSGPIGIVVDTSKDGPSVHSLKSTSPMLGLISPGDLIVALDGEDTRKMTAAALTRLMARKSRQKERKITLLS